MRFLVVFLVSALLPGMAIAQSYKANEFYETCRDTASSQLLCIGYMKGVVDGVRGHVTYKYLMARGPLPINSKEEAASHLVEMQRQFPFCPPKSGTIELYKDIVVTKLERSPELRDLSAAYVIIDTLSKTFPCN